MADPIHLISEWVSYNIPGENVWRFYVIIPATFAEMA